jgi:folate-dependent phosphoribosylglycinamide formyltransferase PurN
MRIVILSSGVYSETACAMASALAQAGHVPVGALALRTLHRPTVVRKIAQWGVRGTAQYARAKLIPRQGDSPQQLQNPQLQPLLAHGARVFRSLREVAAFYNFPVVSCDNQNAPASVSRLKEWSPDIMIFAGGNILRKPLLDVPRLGVLNAHLGLLPEIRGMSSPEWSLLNHVPVGVTIHYVDAGIDTGPILQRCEFPDAARCESLTDLRHRLIAFAITQLVDVVVALDRGTISATPQSDLHKDNQFFVMHEWLQARAAERLAKTHLPADAVPG